MAKNKSFVENYNLVNCYVDTSYYVLQNNTIYTSKFNNELEQTERIRKYLVVVANPGFKLKPQFSFKLQPKREWDDDSASIEWVEVTHNNFYIITEELNLNINVTRDDFQLAGIDLSKSLVFETTIDGTTYYLFLLGGFNEHKFVFALYRKITSSSHDTYGDIKLNNTPFTLPCWDWDEGGIIGYISILNDLMFTAESEEELEPDINDSFFTTYYVDIDTLREIRQKGTVTEDLIINTYSYPIKFTDRQLVESTIKAGYTSTEITTKIFKKNYTSLDIFKFTVPDISDVTECYIKIPFNSDISLDYEDIKGKTIRGYITYEVLSNTTTLFIEDEDGNILYKNIISIGVEIPYKPTGELKGFKDVQTRLAYEEPKLYIKGVGKSVKGNYLRGFIKPPNNILKDELDLLNSLLNEGVFINDGNN